MKKRLLAGLVPLLCLLSAQNAGRDPDNSQAERQEWFYRQRAWPHDRIPTGARARAVFAIQELERTSRERQMGTASVQGAGAAAAATAGPQWKLIGPRPTDDGTTYSTAGRVNAIAIDPRDDNTIYIGAAEGGVWKTTDGGANWTPLTDDQPSLATGAIVLDPNNPDIIYAGTGEENFSYDSYYGAGILKSTNGGATWNSLPGPFTGLRIGVLAISADSQVMLAATDGGLWRSEDGAATWRTVLTGASATSVVFDPANPVIAYAALGATHGSGSNGVYKSSDRGLSWTLITGSGSSALPFGNQVGRMDIGLAPSTPSTLYVQVQSAAPFGEFMGIYKTTDGGNTWNQTAGSIPASAFGTQLWYDNVIRVHPKNPDVVYSGTIVVARSLDGGRTWNFLPESGPDGMELHVDQHALAFNRDGSKLLIGNDGGVWSTTNVQTGPVTWNNLNHTLAITQFYPGLATSAADANLILAGTQDNGTQRYSGDISWSSLTCGDGGWNVIDTVLSSFAYTACQNIDVRRSSDVAGRGFWLPSSYGIDQTDHSSFIPPFVGDPSNPQTLYFGTFRLWRSGDGAGRWTPISSALTSDSNASIRTIAVAPSDPSVIYAGTSDARIMITQNAVTQNAADPSSTVWNLRSGGLPTRVIPHIEVDPIDAGTAIAVFSGFVVGSDVPGHIFRTTDFGNTWTNISKSLPDVPVVDLVIDPDLPDTMYAATDAGVMYTADGGNTWNTLGAGLPKVVVHSLSLHRGARVLRAATHGRSAWEIALPLPSPSAQPVLSSIAPASVDAGKGALQLAVSGSGFTSDTVVRWNGQPRPTVFSDSGHLSAAIAASDVDAVGRAAVSVFKPSRGGGASAAMNFTIGPAPATAAAAILNAANSLTVKGLAPGGIATIYGTNFTAAPRSADAAPPLPSLLGGVSLSLTNAGPVPLFYVGPNQINFQVPWYLDSGTRSLTIQQGTLTSVPVPVTIVPYAPALFSTSQDGKGQAAAILASDGAIPAPAGQLPRARPAKKGEFVELYATGLGRVENSPATGSPASSDPFSKTFVTPTATVGNAAATVSFSGLAPGYIGLYQVNVQVPDSAPSGAAVPVSIQMGSVASNVVTIAIE